MRPDAKTFFALLLVQLFAHQTLIAPLAWADCPHHFALWATASDKADSALANAPLCGASRGHAKPGHRGDQPEHGGPCRCGDLQGHLPGAVRAPVPLAWMLVLPAADRGRIVAVESHAAGIQLTTLLPDANAPPPLV
ncbi:MAG: hypothetical protein D6761_13145 [Candidatus Dadabacteria bacterium]|nr:MAG: hypothetical protein D6761_13145 [Candidatus Dadabacteria bacterium]